MKHIIQTIFLFILCLPAFAHEGEEHGAAKKTAPASTQYFSSETLSDKYEVLVKYGELEAGGESILRMFISEAATNRAVDSAKLTISVVNKPALALSMARLDTGIYELKGIFPANGSYDLQISINSPSGPDLLQISKIEVGKKLEVAVEEEHAHWYSNPWLWAVTGLLIGILLMYLLMRNRYRKVAASIIIISLLIPTASMNPSRAHEGEQHGNAAAPKSGGISSSFIVEKESQFLFDIITQKTGEGNFYESTEILGTVTASPQGLAVIQVPQTGKIVSLRVRPGQSVSKGQTMAIVEQQVEAGTQLDIIAQRNTLNAEVKAAKAQYERLKAIEDIAAKKDVTEARARYEAAVQNLQLFNANAGSNMASTKMITLTAPISGVVGTFNYAIGAVVSSGQTLFEITNLDRVYVETQVFAANMEDIRHNRFVAFSNYDTVTYSLRLISTAQAVNTENQAQRVVFEIENAGGKFRIGENVRVLQYGRYRLLQLVVPTASLADINGKPAVFIKDKAEQYSVSFIQKGQSNAIYTAITSGVEAGERVVTENVYQMKMIYLNQ